MVETGGVLVRAACIVKDDRFRFRDDRNEDLEGKNAKHQKELMCERGNVSDVSCKMNSHDQGIALQWICQYDGES